MGLDLLAGRGIKAGVVSRGLRAGARDLAQNAVELACELLGGLAGRSVDNGREPCGVSKKLRDEFGAARLREL